MAGVHEVPVPPDSLLGGYSARGYVDAWAVTLDRPLGLAAFIRAFYESRAFRPERIVLGFAGLRGSAADLEALAEGGGTRFAAWTVEARRSDQVLLAAGRTRSWLAVAPAPAGCTLRFGSAVVACDDGRLGPAFAALLGFHRVYSRLLLVSAVRRLAALRA